MHALGHSNFNRRILYARTENGVRKPGWIKKFDWNSRNPIAGRVPMRLSKFPLVPSAIGNAAASHFRLRFPRRRQPYHRWRVPRADRIPRTAPLHRRTRPVRARYEHGIELALHGQALIQDLRREPGVRGHLLRGVKVGMDKLTRTLAWAPLAEEGKVNPRPRSVDRGVYRRSSGLPIRPPRRPDRRRLTRRPDAEKTLQPLFRFLDGVDIWSLSKARSFKVLGFLQWIVKSG